MPPAEYLNALFSLQGKTALLTGATRGIGQEIAVAYASAGADIVLAQRDLSNKDTFDKIKKLGVSCDLVQCDLAEPNSVKSLVERVTAQGHTIDILLNCGGMQRRNPPEDFTDEDWDLVVQVNMSSVFTLTREVGKHMLATDRSQRGRGKIVTVASVVSFQGGVNIPAYAATKHGLSGLAKSFSNSWSAKGINVNNLCPGYVTTELNPDLRADKQSNDYIISRTPFGRWATPQEMVGAAIFLASSASDYVCGENLVVDGGPVDGTLKGADRIPA